MDTHTRWSGRAVGRVAIVAAAAATAATVLAGPVAWASLADQPAATRATDGADAATADVTATVDTVTAAAADTAGAVADVAADASSAVGADGRSADGRGPGAGDEGSAARTATDDGVVLIPARSETYDDHGSTRRAGGHPAPPAGTDARERVVLATPGPPRPLPDALAASVADFAAPLIVAAVVALFLAAHPRGVNDVKLRTGTRPGDDLLPFE